MKKTDIVFVSNFSNNLNKTFEKVTEKLENNSYKILTYRRTDIENSYSYEEYLEKNFNDIKNLDSYELSKKYKKLNIFLPVVGERYISNYFFGTENAFGHKKLSDYEIDFLLKSYVLFLEEYISNTKLVFSGYADNFISILTYHLANFYKKRCLTFHGISLIDMESCYITENFFCKPCNDLILANDNTPDNLVEHIKQYDIKKHIKDLDKNKDDFKKPIFGIISQNLFDISYIKLSLFGYKVSDQKLKTYLNIDNPDFTKKLFANIGRVYNKFRYKRYINKNKDVLEENERFIYFPLQLQPEASTGAVSPLIMNQIYVIENISKTMPLGFTLVIKEHPVAIGMREQNFYKLIQRLPRVKLLGDEYSGKDLVKSSQLVIGYGGTTLFECITNGKKIVLLSKDYMYSDSKLIKISNGFDYLHNEIVDFLELHISDEEIEDDIQKMLKFFYVRRFSLYKNFHLDIVKSLDYLLRNFE